MAEAVHSDRTERMLYYLGGNGVLRMDKADLAGGLAMVKLVRRGLPVESARWARDHLGVARQVFHTIVPRQTIDSAAKSSGQRLTTAQSERLLRIARVYALAEEAFGDRARAQTWMADANPALEDARPLELLDTEQGAEAVETMLGRMMYGVVA